jgi:hypothetical protein
MPRHPRYDAAGDQYAGAAGIQHKSSIYGVPSVALPTNRTAPSPVTTPNIIPFKLMRRSAERGAASGRGAMDGGDEHAGCQDWAIRSSSGLASRIVLADTANSGRSSTKSRTSKTIATVHAPVGTSLSTTCNGSPNQVPFKKFLIFCNLSSFRAGRDESRSISTPFPRFITVRIFQGILHSAFTTSQPLRL